MQLISLATYNCVRFKLNITGESAYVNITGGRPNLGCHTQRGRKLGDRVLLITRDCVYSVSLIQALLLVVLGFSPDYLRPDRDEYLTIDWTNVQESYKKLLKPTDEGQDMELPFDYDSALLRSRNNFAVDFNKPTIIPKNVSAHDNCQCHFGLSQLDVMRIKKAYGCLTDEDRAYIVALRKSTVKV